ncbi:MAG: hypothetical protein Q8R83_07185 [Legionellaceae bacterium]|nr:hypothetical protein [Legionellaceae bacterium]
MIDALKHQNCPENFTLHVGRISSVAWKRDKGNKELIQHVSSELKGEKKYPFGLRIKYETQSVEDYQKSEPIQRREIANEDHIILNTLTKEARQGTVEALTTQYEKEYQNNLQAQAEMLPKLIEEIDQEFEKLNNSFKKNDELYIKTEIEEITSQILIKLTDEICAFIQRKSDTHQANLMDIKTHGTKDPVAYAKELYSRKGKNLGPKDNTRYQELMALCNDIIAIKNNTQIDISSKDGWKEQYKNEVLSKINDKLSNGKLDKYDYNIKNLIVLLNALLAPIAVLRYGCARTAFFSTEGKSKEAVKDVKKFAESITPSTSKK